MSISLACSHGEVRFVQYKPVEVCVEGIWAGICSDTIDASAVAGILCKQLLGVEESRITSCSSDPLQYSCQ